MPCNLTILLPPDRLASEADREALHDFMDAHGLTRLEVRVDPAIEKPEALRLPARVA